ncbi:MAG: leucine-rich repeat protein [Candidatus Thorarchaeota archaeon]
MVGSATIVYKNDKGEEEQTTIKLDAQEIQLSNKNIAEIDLHQLSTFTDLRKLDLSYNCFHSIDLSPLVECIKLETILLGENEFHEIDLTPLTNCQNLMKLDFFECRFDVLDLNPLVDCEFLMELNLYASIDKCIGIESICRIPSLTHLDIDLAQSDSSVLGVEDHFSPIVSLDISVLSASQLHLASFPELLEINIYIRNPNNPRLPDFSGCENLEIIRVTLEGHPATIDLSSLENCWMLRDLEIADSWLEFIDLSPLSRCIHLERICVFNSKLNQVDLSPLKDCQNLVILDLCDNLIESLDLEPLSKCGYLAELNLFENQLESLDLSPLENCQHLQFVYLLMNHLRVLDVSPIIGCRYLDTLQLDNSVTLIINPAYQNEKLHGAILEYKTAGRVRYQKFDDVSKEDWVCKIILMGEPGAGKSSFLNALIERIPLALSRPSESMTTIGVKTELLNMQKLAENFIFNVWDFGGQAEFTCIHKLFFTEESVFLFFFKPQRWENIRFDYWFDMFVKQSHGKGVFVPIRTHLHPDGLEDLVDDYWNQIKGVLSASLSERGKTYDVFPDIFEIDSLQGEGIDSFIDKLPELVKASGIHPAQYTSTWWDYLGEVLKVKRSISDNDLGIMSVGELNDKIQETLKQPLTDVVPVQILTRMHEQGDLIFLPNSNEIDSKSLVLLNADLASRLTYRLHRCATRSFTPGIIKPDKNQDADEIYYDWEKKLRIENDISIHYNNSSINELISFLSSSGHIVVSKYGVVFLNAVHHTPQIVDDLWKSNAGKPAIAIIGVSIESFQAVLSFFIREFQLKPLAVWLDGAVLIDQAEKTVLRIDIQIVEGKHGLVELCKVLASSSRVRDISKTANFLIGAELAFRNESNQSDSDEDKLAQRVTLELTCPNCFEALKRSDEGISCISCGPPHNNILKPSIKIYKSAVPRTHYDLGLSLIDFVSTSGFVLVEGNCEEIVFPAWKKMFDSYPNLKTARIVNMKGKGKAEHYITAYKNLIKDVDLPIILVFDRIKGHKMREQLRKIGVHDDLIVVLDEGDIEDYYPVKPLEEHLVDHWNIETESNLRDILGVGNRVRNIHEFLEKNANPVPDKSNDWKIPAARFIATKVNRDDYSKEEFERIKKIMRKIDHNLS